MTPRTGGPKTTEAARRLTWGTKAEWGLFRPGSSFPGTGIYSRWPAGEVRKRNLLQYADQYANGQYGLAPQTNEDGYKEGSNQINILEHHTLKAFPAGASLCTAGVLHANLFVGGLAPPKLCNDPESHCF